MDLDYPLNSELFMESGHPNKPQIVWCLTHLCTKCLNLTLLLVTEKLVNMCILLHLERKFFLIFNFVKYCIL